MEAGYIYILINQSMPGLIKVGVTTRDARARARELSNTAIPTPFQVAFEVFSEDCKNLEKKIHFELSDYRVSVKREFFRYPLDKAISLIQSLISTPSEENSIYSAEDIMDRLSQKYPEYLQKDIVAVRIVQPKDRVWLEITTEGEVAGYLKDQIIKRSDLAFISDGAGENVEDLLFFDPQRPVSENALRFVEDFDAYSIIHTTDLFNEQACNVIQEQYNCEHSNKS
jgi:hypothetical protein